jgi:hypothetical protein
VFLEATFAAFATTSGTKTFEIRRNGVTVGSRRYFFNSGLVNVYQPMLDVYAILPNETGTNTYSIHLATSGTSVGTDAYCTMIIQEYK